MKLASFLISLVVAALMAGLCVVGIVHALRRPGEEGSATVILGGLLFLIPFGGWALAEWQAYVGKRSDFERQAAFCAFAFGALLLFASAAVVIDAANHPNDGKPATALSTLLGILPLGVWLAATGVRRIRAAGPPESAPWDEADESAIDEAPPPLPASTQPADHPE